MDWIYIIIIIVLILAVIAKFAWHYFRRGSYKIGWSQKTTQKFTNLSQIQTNSNYWTVEEYIHLSFIEVKPKQQKILPTKQIILWVHGGPAIAPDLQFLAQNTLQPIADATGVTCYGYHQRGCGDSTRPITSWPKHKRGGRNYSSNVKELENKIGLTALVGDIERIRNILNVEKVILIGHSFGGFISSLYTAEFPLSVSALCLISPAPLYKFPLKNELNLFNTIEKKMTKDIDLKEWKSFVKEYLLFSSKIFERDEEKLSELHFQFAKYYLKVLGKNHVDLSVNQFINIDNEEEKIKFSGGWAAMAVYFSMGMEYDWSNIIREKSRSKYVHLILGMKDISPALEIEKVVKEIYPQVKIDQLGAAGHCSFATHPKDVAKLISNFCQSIL